MKRGISAILAPACPCGKEIGERLEGDPRVAYRIGVVGAGYAGLAALQRLQRRAARPDLPRFAVELINPASSHVCVTELHKVAAGQSTAGRVNMPLSRLLAPGWSLRLDRALAVPSGPLAVDLASGGRTRYDALILAPGWEPDDHGVPGIAERALALGGLPQALILRDRLRGLLRGPGPRRLLIAGAGLTGVELAAEVAEAAGGRVGLTLLEGGPRILPALPPAAARAAARVLTGELGVVLHTGDPVAAAAPGELRLHSGRALPFDLLVWCGGVRANRLLAASGLPCNRRGQVETGPALEVPGRPGLFVAGDAAAAAGAPPPSARLAEAQGAAAAEGALRRLSGRDPLPFIPPPLAQIVSLGRRRAIGVLGGEVLSGPAAVALKRAGETAHAAAAGGAVALLGRGLGLEFPGPPGGR